MAKGYLAEPFGEFVDRVAAPQPAPAAGSVVAATVSLSAGLATKAARLSGRQLPVAEDMAERLVRLRARATALADADARAYRTVLEARREEGVAGLRTQQAWRVATEVPAEISRIGGEVAELAARLAREGNPNLRGDAVTALLLAEAAVASAAHLVELNVAAGGLDPDEIGEVVGRVRQVRELVHDVSSPVQPDQARRDR